jgi:hypothetical protein
MVKLFLIEMASKDDPEKGWCAGVFTQETIDSAVLTLQKEYKRYEVIKVSAALGEIIS